MSCRVLVTLSSIMLVGAIWAVQLVSAAQAQTATDHPAAFTGSLVELPTIDRGAIRHTVFVPAYSTIRLGSGKGKVDLATTLSIHNTSEERPLILLRVDYFGTTGNLLQARGLPASSPFAPRRPSPCKNSGSPLSRGHASLRRRFLVARRSRERRRRPRSDALGWCGRRTRRAEPN